MRALLIRIILVTFLFVFFISGQLQAQEKSDGRFIAKGNGTVLDTKTGLMWAARDNGSDIKWLKAKSYCENYRGGGYTGWRMPTREELAGLYDANKSQKVECSGLTVHVATDLIHLTCLWSWASERRGSSAADFDFMDGKWGWYHKLIHYKCRVLPVRFSK